MRESTIMIDSHDVNQLLLVSGLCADSPLPDGSGFSVINWHDDRYVNVWFSTDDAAHNNALNELIALGVTVTVEG